MSQFVFSSYAPKQAVAGVKYVNVNFHSPNGSVKTIPYAFTGQTGVRLRQAVDEAKLNKDNFVLFRTKAGFSPVYFTACKNPPEHCRLLQFDGLVRVDNPKEKRTELQLDSLFGKSVSDEQANKYIYVGPEVFRKSFKEQVLAYAPVDVASFEQAPKGEYVFQSRESSQRPDLKYVNVTFPNYGVVQYAYGPETKKYLDAALDNEKIWFDMFSNAEDEDFKKIQIEFLESISPNKQVRELVFVGARNVRNINQFRKELGLSPVRNERLELENEYYTVSVFPDTMVNRDTGQPAFKEFLERSSLTYTFQDRRETQSVTKLDTKVSNKETSTKEKTQKVIKNSKYELVKDDIKEVTYNTKYMTNQTATVYRIRALKNFGDVKAGDLGGYVSSQDNLGRSGTCWVHDDSVVAGTGKVMGNSQVRDHSFIYSGVHVRGDSVIRNSTVMNNESKTLKIVDETIENQVIGKTCVETHKEIASDNSIKDLDAMLEAFKNADKSDEELFDEEFAEYESMLQDFQR